MRIAALLLVLSLGACVHMSESGPLLSEATMPEIQAIAAYKFGDSEEPLTVAEDMVTQAMNTGENAEPIADNLAALLGTGATLDAKLFACRQLAIIGTERHVSAIAPLLLSPDTNHMARYALEPIPGASVDRALIDALGQAPDALKPGIINTLGARHAQRATGAIKEYASSSDPEIAAAATSALKKILM